MEPSITLIITTWNSLETLKLFWGYLKRYTTVPFNAVIVDNGSTDGTLDFLKTLNVTVITNPHNEGVVKALNQAEHLVKTRFLLSISDDVLVSPNWLEEMIALYESDSLIKTVVPIKPGTKIKHPYYEESSRSVWERIKKENMGKKPEGLIEQFCLRKPYEEFVEDIKKTNNFGEEHLECPPDFASGCCVLVETDFIRKIGGFSDTRFQIYGCEDVDRCWRIGKAGFRVVRTSRVFVHHLEGVSLFKNNLAWKELMKKNNKILIKKWKEEFWPMVRTKIQNFGTISEVVKKHWIIGWLLESLSEEEIPADLKPSVKDFLVSYEKRLS